MESRLSMSNLLNCLADHKAKVHAKRESRKAHIFDEESPVCTLENRENCYDPLSFEKAFYPLGIFAKLFGLFPCFDCDFVKSLNEAQVKCIHFLDYCYSALIFLLLTGGVIICYFMKPKALLKWDDANSVDYIAKQAIIYSTIAVGIQSLFIFPTKWSEVLKFVKLFTNIDKILRFDGRMEERWFAIRVIIYFIICFLFTFVSFMFLFAYAIPDPNYTDYFMGPIMTMALMALIIPTGFAIFFLNAIRLRMEHFNRRLDTMLKPLIPFSGACGGFQDYGKDLDEVKLEKRQDTIAEDLEKMRILHSEIRMSMGMMSCIFGMHLVRDFLYCLIALILHTYALLYFPKYGTHVWIVYAGQSVFILMKLFVIVCYAQVISCQGRHLQGTLQRVSLRRLHKSGILQIQAFLSSIGNHAHVSANGYFIINKSLMTSIVGAITTYFIILLQFKIEPLGRSKSD